MYKKGASLFVILIFFITFSLYTSPNVSAESHISEVPEGYVGIYTAEDLNKMRENLNSKYILMNDIDLSHATSEGGDFYHNGAGWEPIGTKEKPFEGTFDGNGYNIIGMKINIKTDQTIYAGLFGYGEDLTVQNLGMVNSSITVENTSIYSDSSDVYAGAIVGYIDTSYPTRGSIDHSYNTGNIKANSMFDSYAGGLVGFAEMTNITESYNTGDISANEAGGIIGKLQSSESTIISSYNEGKITAEEYAGGIVATTFGKQIKDSKNKGDIISNNIAAGIAGYTASNISIINAVNEGKITGDYRAVGLVGSLGYNSTIQGSQNRGDVTATDYASGIAGGLSSSIIVDSYNTGHIISKEFYAAGITFSSNNKSTILRTYNAGTVEAYYTGAGITTTNYQNSTIRDTFNIGDVKSRNHVSGIAGNNYGLIENTYNLGNIDSSYSFSYEAAIVGKNESGTVTNNYYLNTASNGVLPTNGLDTDEGARSITYEQLQDASTFQGFDFDSTWTMNGNEDFKFPELKDNQVDATEEILDVVTKSNPNKETYVEGEPLDITGAVITARTNFGNTSDVEVTPDMVVSNYNPNQIGGQNVKVAYQDNFAYFYVRVNEKDRIPPKEVTDIQVSSTTNTVEITFTNPTDTDFVTAKLYVYGEYVGEVKDGHYLLEELSSNTNYPIRVTTVDDKGNESKGVGMTATTQMSFSDMLLYQLDLIRYQYNSNLQSMKLWEFDTVEKAREYEADNRKEELDQQLNAYKESIRLKDLTDQSPTLKDFDPNKVLKIDFNMPIDPSTVIKNENVFIRHQAEFVEDINIQVAEDGKTIYILPPANGYPSGEYSLYVDTSVQSLDGVDLENPIVVKFEVK